MHIHIIPFEGLDEGFGHAVGFGTSDRRETTDESHILSKGNRFSGSVATAIVAEPFDSMREPCSRPEAPLDAFNHQIPHYLTGNAAGSGHMTDDFPVTTIQRKGNRTTCPFQQAISSPSEHQRRLERSVTILPS